MATSIYYSKQPRDSRLPPAYTATIVDTGTRQAGPPDENGKSWMCETYTPDVGPSAFPGTLKNRWRIVAAAAPPPPSVTAPPRPRRDDSKKPRRVNPKRAKRAERWCAPLVMPAALSAVLPAPLAADTHALRVDDDADDGTSPYALLICAPPGASGVIIAVAAAWEDGEITRLTPSDDAVRVAYGEDVSPTADAAAAHASALEPIAATHVIVSAGLDSGHKAANKKYGVSPYALVNVSTAGPAFVAAAAMRELDIYEATRHLEVVAAVGTFEIARGHIPVWFTDSPAAIRTLGLSDAVKSGRSNVVVQWGGVLDHPDAEQEACCRTCRNLMRLNACAAAARALGEAPRACVLQEVADAESSETEDEDCL